ncbi:MAG: adenine deaminase [Candidatus Korarchaeota archaeon NZ13-K]|nr:MAG: adenine deaminase [Candidatus Korarchaeota archaeon NZ13-K]
MRSRIWEVSSTLVRVALGIEKADLVILNSNFVNVNSGEVLEGYGVAVKGDRVAAIGEVSHTIGPRTQVIDARGMYLVPGFIDAHVHVESSMLCLTNFAKVVLPRGTTSVFIDPHEIANVLGLEGVRIMVEESRDLPLKVFVTAPSCVPANPSFETSGAHLGVGEVEEMLSWDGVVALGEMMNYPGVLATDPEVFGKINAAHRAGKVVEGHDAGLLGRELTAYAAAGISSSHEMTRKVDAIERLRLGMYAYMREGSAWLDVKETVKAITEAKLDSRHACLVTDDREVDSIIKQGHMDHVVRRAIEEGLDPIRAIQMATINPAEHYGLAREIGSVAPSRLADILLLRDLTRVEVDTVIADGRVVAREGKLAIDMRPPSYDERYLRTVRLHKRLQPDDFRIRAPMSDGRVRVRVIEAMEGSVLTKCAVEELEVRGGEILPDASRMIYKVAVVERHKASGNMGLGFVKGFGFRLGAVASTIAHDNHNLLVLGMSDRDMALAVNTLAEAGGGIVTVDGGEVLSLVRLPLAGLMSTDEPERVAEELERTYDVWRERGCGWVSPFMTMSLLALDVLPELRITDRGLIDTVNFRYVDLIYEHS